MSGEALGGSYEKVRDIDVCIYIHTHLWILFYCNFIFTLSSVWFVGWLSCRQDYRETASFILIKHDRKVKKEYTDTFYLKSNLWL